MVFNLAPMIDDVGATLEDLNVPQHEVDEIVTALRQQSRALQDTRHTANPGNPFGNADKASFVSKHADGASQKVAIVLQDMLTGLSGYADTISRYGGAQADNNASSVQASRRIQQAIEQSESCLGSADPNAVGSCTVTPGGDR